MGSKSTDLGSRVDGVPFSIVGVLMHEDNCRSLISLNKTSSSDQSEVSDGRITNASDMSLVEVGRRDDPDIRTSHATIGSPINERTGRLGGCMLRKIILDCMRIDLAVEVTINVDETVLCDLGTRGNRRRD